MKDYFVTITVTWVQSIEAESEADAKSKAKDLMLEEFNFTPEDTEIIAIEEA